MDTTLKQSTNDISEFDAKWSYGREIYCSLSQSTGPEGKKLILVIIGPSSFKFSISKIWFLFLSLIYLIYLNY